MRLPSTNFARARSIPMAARLWATVLLISVCCAGDVRADYITTADAAQRAIEAIVRRAGGTARLLDVAVDKASVTVRMQGKQKSHHVDEWVARRSIFGFGGDSISGPRQVQGPTYVNEIEGGFFDLAEVSFDKLEALKEAAIAHAALEDAAEIAGMRLARATVIAPKAAYGNIRWEVRVTSRSESATIFATAKGAIFSADLSSTLRAKRLNLLRDDAVLPRAAVEIAAVLGVAEVVHDVSFNETYIFIRADHPRNPKLEARYSWNLNGMRDSSLGDSPSSFRTFGGRQAFAFSEVDFAVLPALKAAAFRVLAMEGGSITRLQAEKPTRDFGPPQLIWELVIKKDDLEGKVLADAKGRIFKVLLPPEKRKPIDWLEPQGVLATLARLGSEIGETTRMLELLLNDRGASITAEDPRKPGTPINLVVDEDSIRRFGKPVFEKSVPAERAFTISDLRTLDAAAIETLIKRTTVRLNAQDGKLARITISRGDVFVRPPEGSVMLELRMVTADGDSAGRVVYSMRGQELQVVGP